MLSFSKSPCPLQHCYCACLSINSGPPSPRAQKIKPVTKNIGNPVMRAPCQALPLSTKWTRTKGVVFWTIKTTPLFLNYTFIYVIYILHIYTQWKINIYFVPRRGMRMSLQTKYLKLFSVRHRWSYSWFRESRTWTGKAVNPSHWIQNLGT